MARLFEIARRIASVSDSCAGAGDTFAAPGRFCCLTSDEEERRLSAPGGGGKAVVWLERSIFRG